MPRTLKRRSEAISRDVSPPASSPEPEQSQPRRRRSQSRSSAASSDPDDQNTTQATQQTSITTLTKKLIRLALACEYSRLPLRRNDISQKIFKESNASHRLFKPVFAAAQKTLASTFGMQLVELPTREKTSLKDRRTQATQAAVATQQNSKSQNGTNATANKSWILTSILPDQYKTNPSILKPSRAPTLDIESTYTALYTFIVSLIQLSPSSSLSESKLERLLKRVNADTYTPAGTLDKLLARMTKEGYIERRKDINAGEESVEYVIGPRGKVEIGVQGTAGLVRTVYGFGAVSLGTVEDGHGNGDGDDDDGGENNAQPTRLVKMEKDELEKRLVRSLGDGVKESNSKRNDEAEAMEVDGGAEADGRQNTERLRVRRSTRRRRNEDENDDNDEDDD